MIVKEDESNQEDQETEITTFRAINEKKKYTITKFERLNVSTDTDTDTDY